MIQRYNFLQKNRSKLFGASLLFSFLIHIAVIIPYSIKNSAEIKLPSLQGKRHLINFSLSQDQPKTTAESTNKKNNFENIDLKKDGVNAINKNKRKQNSVSSTGKTQSLSEETLLKIKKTYKSKILMKIHKSKYYPRFARRLGHEGTIVLSFSIDRRGLLNGKVKVVKPCVYDSLNRAGIKTVKKAVPYPPFPESIKLSAMTFTVQLDYRIDEDS